MLSIASDSACRVARLVKPKFNLLNCARGGQRYPLQAQGDFSAIANKHNELDAYHIEGPVDSEFVIRCIDKFCQTLQGPTVLVLDNASIHTSDRFRSQIPRWEKAGLDLFYLPEYSPELNLIEILWRFMKYEWIEFWAYTSWHHLVDYVDDVIKYFGEKYKINFV